MMPWSTGGRNSVEKGRCCVNRKDFLVYENLLYISQLGILMIVPVFGGVVIGKWLEDRFHTGGILFLVTIILFTMSGFLNVYKFIMKQLKKSGRQ